MNEYELRDHLLMAAQPWCREDCVVKLVEFEREDRWVVLHGRHDGRGDAQKMMGPVRFGDALVPPVERITEWMRDAHSRWYSEGHDRRTPPEPYREPLPEGWEAPDMASYHENFTRGANPPREMPL